MHTYIVSGEATCAVGASFSAHACVGWFDIPQVSKYSATLGMYYNLERNMIAALPFDVAALVFFVKCGARRTLAQQLASLFLLDLVAFFDYGFFAQVHRSCI